MGELDSAESVRITDTDKENPRVINGDMSSSVFRAVYYIFRRKCAQRETGNDKVLKLYSMRKG